jgi:hypothetical protein
MTNPPEQQFARFYFPGAYHGLATTTSYTSATNAIHLGMQWMEVEIDGKPAKVNLALATHVEAYERTPF